MKNQNIKTEDEITFKSVDEFLKIAGEQILKVFDNYEFDNFSDNQL